MVAYTFMSDGYSFGYWKFGYWAADGVPIQATMQLMQPVSDPQMPNPILFPLDYNIVRGGVGDVQLVSGGVATNEWEVSDNGTPDGAIRLLFDQTQLVDGESYRISFNVVGVVSPTQQLIVNWCDSPPLIVQAPTTNPVVVDLPPPPLGYGLVRRFLEVRLPDFEAGSFTISSVQAQQV